MTMQTKLTAATGDGSDDKAGNKYGYITGLIVKKGESIRVSFDSKTCSI